jgi:predicted lipoprotein with Yx(FWY)xxD motif
MDWQLPQPKTFSEEHPMKSVKLGSAVLLTLFSLSAHAVDPAPLKKSNGVLVDAKGMTVYIFDKDVANSGKSACTGQCAQNWPPVPAGNAQPAAPYSAITRDDGSKQLVYKGKPLYTFVKDKKAGDKSGDQAMDAWHVVKD